MTYRGPDATFWRMVARLLEEKDHIGGVSLHWAMGGDWRVTAHSKDPRRDVDLPGIEVEADEKWDHSDE